MIYCNKDNVFHLQTKDTSYILRALPSGQLESMYYGKRIRNRDDFTFLYDKHECGYSNTSPRSQKDTSLSRDHIAREYSAYGKGDYRLPAMDVLAADDTKLAGAAQRRTRKGILHQGSVSLKAGEHDLILNAIRDELRKAFDFEYESFTPDAAFMAGAEKLASGKYATPEWNENGVVPE